MSTPILSIPKSESLSRHRTFDFPQLRPDHRDVTAQLAILLAQLRDERFNGQLTFHFNAGLVRLVETVEKQKL